MAHAFDLIIPGCWIVFILYWIVSARQVKAVAEKQSVWTSLTYRMPLICSYFLMVAGRLPRPWNLRLTPHTDWARLLGVVICGFGLFITIWARRTLAGNWSSVVTFKEGHELVRTGPYRFARHPIYTGILTMCLGTAIENGQLRAWLALPLMAISFWIKLKQEEQLLVRHFPDTYPAYQKQVKAFVPFVL